MIEEYKSIMKNDVWEIMPRPKEKSMVTSKWVYKIKYVVDISMDKYKARFIAIGFSQKEGEYYDETSSPISIYISTRSIMSLVASMRWSLHQMDVNTTLLNGEIEE
jgi:hypothetical protein